MNNSRQIINHQQSRPNKLHGISVLILIAIAIVAPIVAVTADNNSHSPEAIKKAKVVEQKKVEDAKIVAEQKSRERQTIVDKYAPMYCQLHTDTITTDANILTSNGWPTHTVRTAWTDAECNTIVGKLYDEGSSEDDLQRIVDGKVWVGQTFHQLIYSWGSPNDSNSSNYGLGTTYQLIYRRGDYHNQYVYLEDGKVTSYQDY